MSERKHFCVFVDCLRIFCVVMNQTHWKNAIRRRVLAYFLCGYEAHWKNTSRLRLCHCCCMRTVCGLRRVIVLLLVVFVVVVLVLVLALLCLVVVLAVVAHVLVLVLFLVFLFAFLLVLLIFQPGSESVLFS